MVLLWILGVETLLAGATASVVLREGAIETVRSGIDAGDLKAALANAWFIALSQDMQRAFPLSIAQALLASTLVLSATLVLVGRPSARSFALQAIAANAVFAVIQYVLLAHARGAWVDMAVGAHLALQDPALAVDPAQLAQGYFWTHRSALIFLQIGVPSLAALALTRPRTKTYFAEAAAASESAEEEP